MTEKNQVETKLLTQIKEVLSTFPEYWEGDVLLRNKVIEDLRSYEEKVIEALLANELIKETYSIKFTSTTVFKIEDFISMLRYKNYWENSYTNYTNEIGLTSEGKYLKYDTNVVLDFPHKDGVLEGGMTKEDEGKKEVYYHNVLAKEEVDVLLSSKVLTNIQKVTYNNDNSVSDYDNESMIIRGNNLIALESLEERFAKDFDVIYIDPPYNVKSSNNTFLYNNKFNRSTWLVFMKNRLESAKKLLKATGAIIIAIDENEQAYLGVLLDELFPEHEKHLITIVHNPRGVQGTNFSYMNEFAYFVIPKGKKTIVDRKLSESEITWSPLRNWGGESLRTDAKNCFYPVIVKNGEIIGFGEVTQDLEHPKKNVEIEDSIHIYPIDSSGVERKWRYARQSVESIKDMLRVVERNGVYDIEIGKDFGQYKTVWQDAQYDSNSYGKQTLNKLVPDNPFTFPKSIYNVYDCLYAVVGDNPDAKILDFFAGSGTTGQATLMLNQQDQGNRKFVLIEQMVYADTVIKERMKKLIQDDEYYSKQKTSFYYVDLFELNDKYIKNIQGAKNDEMLDEVISTMKESAYLNFKVDLNRVTSADKGYQSLKLEDKKSALIQVLDMNQLYLNYSEIEDTEHDISDYVKEFNRSFYQKEGDEK